MKLNEFASDEKLDEILPALAIGAAKAGMGAAKAIGGAVKTAANVAGKVGSAVGNAVGSAGNAATKAASGLAGGGMDPAQAAMAAQEQAAKKKEVQDSIKAKEQELIDLRKQLADLG